MPDDALVLDFETVAAINALLARLAYHKPLADLHGVVTLEIVKGEFHEIKVTESFRFKKRKKYAGPVEVC